MVYMYILYRHICKFKYYTLWFTLLRLGCLLNGLSGRQHSWAHTEGSPHTDTDTNTWTERRHMCVSTESEIFTRKALYAGKVNVIKRGGSGSGSRSRCAVVPCRIATGTLCAAYNEINAGKAAALATKTSRTLSKDNAISALSITQLQYTHTHTHTGSKNPSHTHVC